MDTGVVGICRGGSPDDDASEFCVNSVCLTARHARFLVWLRWESRYLGWVNVRLHPVQCIVDMVVIRLSVKCKWVTRQQRNIQSSTFCYFPFSQLPSPTRLSAAMPPSARNKASPREENGATKTPNKRGTRSTTKKVTVSPENTGKYTLQRPTHVHVCSSSVSVRRGEQVKLCSRSVHVHLLKFPLTYSTSHESGETEGHRKQNEYEFLPRERYSRSPWL